MAACNGPEREGTLGGAPAVQEGFATTPDSVRIYYRVVGRGGETVMAPFALFHGTALDRLARGRRVVTYDPRGRGRSDPVPPAKVSLDLLLLDLETVRRAVGAERVALIGWSGAGMETFVYALRHPERVARLVQLAPVAPRLEPYGTAMMEDRRRRTDTVALAALEARRSEYQGRPDAWCRDRTALTRLALLADPAHFPATPDVCGYANEQAPRLDGYFAALFRSIVGYDYRDSLTAVGIPRLIIHGAEDNTPLDGNREWAAGQPSARLVVIEGAGHWPHYEQAERTLGAIETFLRGEWPATAVMVPRN
ncbi:MAG TPA: alpha/beta hydrolase [Gemmatimonadales bacterium]|nr:alpha/beta hydrolase [Gemmatimonadales bacterium]